MRILLILLFVTSLYARNNFSDLYKKNEITQGNIFLSTAENYCQNIQYKKCISALKEFIILYSFHPEIGAVYQKLSKIYKDSGQVTDSIEIDKRIYFKNPINSDGLNAYLEAGKNLARMGKFAEAVNILEKLKSQNYSPAIARKAILELHLITIIKKKNR